MYKTRPAFFFQFGHDAPCVMWMRQETPLEQRAELLARSIGSLELFIGEEAVGQVLPRSVEAAKLLLTELTCWQLGQRQTIALPVLRQNVQAFATIVTEEMDRTHVFTVTDKGNLSVDSLVKGASKGYPAEVTSLLDAKTLKEIDEAGRCLACTLYTASGFHILRSVEMAVKAYVFMENSNSFK